MSKISCPVHLPDRSQLLRSSAALDYSHDRGCFVDGQTKIVVLRLQGIGLLWLTAIETWRQGRLTQSNLSFGAQGDTH
jgi:hypothetical protein